MVRVKDLGYGFRVKGLGSMVLGKGIFWVYGV
jgi:hypothetical protein